MGNIFSRNTHVNALACFSVHMYIHIHKMIGENAIENSLHSKICQVVERDGKLTLIQL